MQAPVFRENKAFQNRIGYPEAPKGVKKRFTEKMRIETPSFVIALSVFASDTCKK
jgi:hypothetical protein